ncbi:MAG: nucleotidyltransferase domain-containing protein [Nevskia sp.]|nr:nucleotidyltransferase domain-containing protein [Nevskia sp.]
MSAQDLPQDVAQGLDTFIAAARAALGEQLVAAALFGSAAEGRLRVTSDVNLILVLSCFDAARIRELREPLRLAHATIRLETMMILQDELPAASEAFAVKFADIRERHKLLFGPELFGGFAPSRAALLARLRQILLNFVLRTRERYALVSLREEQLAVLVADAAGPLRSAAGLILQLEGRSAATPREALETLARELDPGDWQVALQALPKVREHGALAAGEGEPAVLQLIELAQAMLARTTALA